MFVKELRSRSGLRAASVTLAKGKELKRIHSSKENQNVIHAGVMALLSPIHASKLILIHILSRPCKGTGLGSETVLKNI